MLMSCRTSSYFSSIDKRSLLWLRQFFDPLRKRALLIQEQVDFLTVCAQPQTLEPFDFALQRGTFPFAAQPFEDASAFCQISGTRHGGGVLACDARDKLGAHCT